MRFNLTLGFWGTAMLVYLAEFFDPKHTQLGPWFLLMLVFPAVSFVLATLITWAWHHHQAVKSDWLHELDKRRRV